MHGARAWRASGSDVEPGPLAPGRRAAARGLREDLKGAAAGPRGACPGAASKSGLRRWRRRPETSSVSPDTGLELPRRRRGAGLGNWLSSCVCPRDQSPSSPLRPRWTGFQLWDPHPPKGWLTFLRTFYFRLTLHCRWKESVPLSN